MHELLVAGMASGTRMPEYKSKRAEASSGLGEHEIPMGLPWYFTLPAMAGMLFQLKERERGWEGPERAEG